MFKMQKDEKRFVDGEAAYLLVFGGCLVIICAFFFSNYDCEAVTKWGYGLLESIRLGELRNFPRFVMEEYYLPTNYTLFVNGITAIWLIPVYLIRHIVAREASLLFFEVWYKVLLVIVLIWDVRLFGDILEDMGFKQKERQIGVGLFLMSSVTLLAALGKGQIDIYGLLFALFAVKCYQKEKYVKMSVFLGLAFLVKPLILWLILPAFLLLIGKEKLRVIVYAGIMVIPFLLDKLVTMLLMPEYMALGKEVAKRMKEYFGGPSMFESMFECEINEVLVFWSLALMICFICYYLAMHAKVERWHFHVFPPLLLILWGIFVCVSYQWYIYVIPFVIVMVLQYKKKCDGYFLVLGINGGLTVYFMVAESMVILPTLRGNVAGHVGEIEAVVMRIAQSLRPYLFPAGKTLFFIAMLVCVGVYVAEGLQEKKRRAGSGKGSEMEEGIQIPAYEKSLLYLQPVPIVLYLMIAFLLCVRG